MRTICLLTLLGCAEPEALPEEALPPVNPALAVGRTYVLDLQSATFTQPPGIDGLLLGLAVKERAFSVLGVRGGEPLLRTGIVEGPPGARQQDPCALTTDVVLRNGPNDRFGRRMNGPLAGYAVEYNMPYRDVTMAGRLGPQATEVDQIRFAATTDMLPLTALGVGDVCQLIVIAGITCVPCPNGSPTCLDVVMEDGVATWDPNLPELREVTPQSRAAAACP
jgi:hypothetical protein